MTIRHVPSTDGVEVAVHDLGGSGTAVLLAHATGFHGAVWGPLADQLPDVWAVAPDLRGHGDTPAPVGGALAWSGFADDVLSVVDELGLDRPVGVGHSKGGAALVLAEERRPGTFRALYLFEPVIFPGPPPGPGGAPVDNPLAAGARRRRPAFPSRAAALDNYAGKPPFNALAAEVLAAYVEHGLADQPDGSARLKCEPEVEATVYEGGLVHDAFAHLDRVRCPVVVARGRLDPFGPAAVSESLVAALPDGRLETFDDLGHFGPLEQPAEVAASIRALLVEVGAA